MHSFDYVYLHILCYSRFILGTSEPGRDCELVTNALQSLTFNFDCFG